MTGSGGNKEDGGGTPLWPFALIGLAAAVYVGVQLAVNIWKSWLLAGSIVAAGMALFWAIWPGGGEEDG